MARRYTEEELAWLRENYPTIGLRGIAGAFSERFGFERTAGALATKSHQMGLHVVNNSSNGTRKTDCERKVFWSREPEMLAWMKANDTGRISNTVEKFEAEFGFKLTREQVSAARSRLGTGSKRGLCNRKWDRPIGYERDSGKGYVYVKVADKPTVPGTRDNWRMKHVIAYEEAYGEVPEGCQVMFVDGDHLNYDPDNLMAVEKSLIGIVNQTGAKWETRDELEAIVAAARLKNRVVDLENRPRTCWRCGRSFTPRNRGSVSAATCPDCVDAGHKKPRSPKEHGEARACAVCGAEFIPHRKTQRRCRRCIEACPKGNVDMLARKAVG